MSCLPLLFDLRDGLGLGVGARPENVPAASAHIELLLEKHGNGEMGVNSESPVIACTAVEAELAGQNAVHRGVTVPLLCTLLCVCVSKVAFESH